MRLSFITFPTMLLVASILLSGCSGEKAKRADADMGEKVRVGSFTYNVLEAEWKSQLGESITARTPQRNFLLIRLSVTNSGGAAATVPSFTLVSSAGDTFPEVQDGSGVPRWLGILRSLEPAQTEDGTILFDVPTNAYRLRLTDGTEEGQTVHVNIPLRLDPAS